MPEKSKHMTREDRLAIEQGIRNKLSFADIAKKTNKAISTISREVKKNLIVTHTGSYDKFLNNCKHRDNCPASRLCRLRHCCRNTCVSCNLYCCTDQCKYYEKEECPSLKKPPYVCTGCNKRNRCKFPKADYHAKEAEENYQSRLRESRSGVTISEEEAWNLAAIFKEGTDKGQSVHHIVVANGGEEAIGYSERTIYAYIDKAILPGVCNLDLPRKVKYKARKKSPSQNLKVDKGCLIGRTYDDYLKFIKKDENKYLHIVEMDSVIGKQGIGEKACLTIIFENCSMMFGFLRDSNNSASVIQCFNNLKSSLGEDVFSRLFPVILTDRGTEFSDPAAIEMSLDGKRQLAHVFYCNPMNSNQKAEAERCHSDFRRIVPKGTSLNSFSQDDISVAFSNVAAIPRPQYFNKTAAEIFIAIYGEEVFKKLGGVFVKPKDANLTPKLLKK